MKDLNLKLQAIRFLVGSLVVAGIYLYNKLPFVSDAIGFIVTVLMIMGFVWGIGFIVLIFFKVHKDDEKEKKPPKHFQM